MGKQPARALLPPRGHRTLARVRAGGQVVHGPVSPLGRAPKVPTNSSDVDQLRAQNAELEAELAQANAAINDAQFFAHRLASLLSEMPDLAATERDIAQVRDEP